MLIPLKTPLFPLLPCRPRLSSHLEVFLQSRRICHVGFGARGLWVSVTDVKQLKYCKALSYRISKLLPWWQNAGGYGRLNTLLGKLSCVTCVCDFTQKYLKVTKLPWQCPNSWGEAICPAGVEGWMNKAQPFQTVGQPCSLYNSQTVRKLLYWALFAIHLSKNIVF